MTDFVLVGGSAWAREIVDWFADAFAASGDAVIGYIQDDGPTQADAVLAVPYLGPISPASVPSESKLILAVAKPSLKALYTMRFPDKNRFISLVHPKALVSRSARLGCGVVVAPFSVVSANADVADFVTLNVFCGVGHDVAVGRCATLSSYVDLTGGVHVGELSYWGSGARAIPGVKVGAETVIGAGSVVVRDVPDGVTVYAMPARRLTL